MVPGPREVFIPVDRRSFLGTLASLVGATLSRRAHAERAADPPSPQQAPAATASADAPRAFFGGAERQALAALGDHLLPGAAALGAVDYIEQLLTAFDHDPPRIFAGGPFSGRRPIARGGIATTGRPPSGFEHWLPLDRVQQRAWRLRLYGSPAVPHPGAAVTGEVMGLRPLLTAGAERAAEALADGRSVAASWDACSDAFRARFRELVLEACFGDPVYGGNRAERGWAEIGFPGDSLPYGYTPFDAQRGDYAERVDAPLTRWPAEEGSAPLGFGARLLIRLMGLGTRIFVD